jgi:hypothetical protein
MAITVKSLSVSEGLQFEETGGRLAYVPHASSRWSRCSLAARVPSVTRGIQLHRRLGSARCLHYIATAA